MASSALVRRDAQGPRERLPPRVELGGPREHLDQRGLRRVLRLGRDGQRARRERAEDGPQGGEDRLEGFAVPFGQAAHPSLERARAPWSNSPPERTPRAVLAARRDRAAARRRRPRPHRGRGQGQCQEGPDHPAPHLASFSGCSLAASTGIGAGAPDRDSPRASVCSPARTCARGRGPMRLLLLALLCAAPAFAGRPFTPEELLATRRLDDPQVSPDGKQVAFTVRQKSLELNRDVKDVWLQPLAGGPARQFTRDGRSEHPRWSPDGKQLLVVSQRAGQDQAQLWLYDLADGGDPRQVTSLFFGADAGVWSPDGRWIAYTSEVYPGCAGDTAAVDACDRKRFEERKASKVEARIVDHLFARHWTEWKDGKRTHVFVQPAQGGPARDLTPGDSDRPTFRLGGGDDIGFTPDGAQVIVSAKPAQREAWSTNGDLWAIAVQGGAPRNLTAGNPGDDASPKPSPDGRWLAWLAQARNGYESDQWKLMLMDRRSGMVSVIGDFGDDVGPFSWRRDSSGLVAAVQRHGRSYLNTVSLEGNVARYADSPASSDFALAPDGSGGPQGVWEDEWGMRWNEAAFAARGYVVLAVNPRGSTGYRRAFEEQISRDWGGLAYDDLIRAVDAAEKLPGVLPGRTCGARASSRGSSTFPTRATGC